MHYSLTLLLLLLSSSCTVKENEIESNLNEVDWTEELLGYGNLHIEGENHTHLFYYFGELSNDLSIKGDTLFLSSNQLKKYLNYYSSLPESTDSLFTRPQLRYLSNDCYSFKLEKNDDLISMYNIHKDSDLPSEIALQMYSSNIPKDLSLLHLENANEKRVKFHWEAPNKLYLNYEWVFMEVEDFETFRKQNVQKTYLNQRDEKILFSYINLFKSHYNNPFGSIESGCFKNDYENVYTIEYNDSLFEYSMHTFPIPFLELMQGLTTSSDPNKVGLDSIFDSDYNRISEKYKHLPYARVRTEKEMRDTDLIKELEYIDSIKPKDL